MLFNSLAPKDSGLALNGFNQWESSRLFMIGDGRYGFQLGVRRSSVRSFLPCFFECLEVAETQHVWSLRTCVMRTLYICRYHKIWIPASFPLHLTNAVHLQSIKSPEMK